MLYAAFFNDLVFYIEYMSRVYFANYIARTRRTNKERPLDGALSKHIFTSIPNKERLFHCGAFYPSKLFYQGNTSVNCLPPPLRKKNVLLSLCSLQVNLEPPYMIPLFAMGVKIQQYFPSYQFYLKLLKLVPWDS